MQWIRDALDSARGRVPYAKRLLRARFFPDQEHLARLRWWDTMWGSSEYAPGWLSGSIPAELEQAVESGWFAPGTSVLDIGCGNGRLARWLADRGFDVVGVDFAEAAVAKANAQRAAGTRLRFEVADVCRDPLGVDCYGALLDRGTLHIVEPGLRKAYARNVAAAASPGAAFLLLHVTSTRHEGFRADAAKKDKVKRRVARLLGSAFAVERVTHAEFGDEREGQPFALGLAFWMVRRVV